jgi:hypothetical protein
MIVVDACHLVGWLTIIAKITKISAGGEISTILFQYGRRYGEYTYLQFIRHENIIFGVQSAFVTI